MKPSLLFCVFVAVAVTHWANAGALTEARVTKIVNDVRISRENQSRPAAVNDVVKDDVVLSTGVKSRSELMFQDDTLTRIGPESSFTFKAGTREMNLKQGALLLQVPKGLGGAKIHTAAVTASITGTTIMIEHTPGKTLKVLVLEGSLRLSTNSFLGDSLVLTPGKMVIMQPDARRIPDPVSVDLAHVMKSSSLVNLGGKKKPLPSAALIQKEVETQQHDKSRANLITTNLVILGKGSNVTIASDELIAALDRDHDATSAIISAANPEPTASPVNSPAPTATPFVSPSITPAPTPQDSPSPTATPNESPSATPMDSPSPTATPNDSPSPSATPSTSPTPSASPSASPTPEPTVSPSATASPTASSSPTATPANIDDPIVVNYGTPDAPLATDVHLNKDVDLSTGGTHGNLNVTTTGKIEVNARIQVSTDAAQGGSKAGGNITLESRGTKEDAINVSDSAQLLSLLNSAAPGRGGTIKFVSAGGKIQLDKAIVTADRGTVDIANTGANGDVNVSNATLHGDVVKVGVLGNNGTLNIDGGTISADSAIDLYAAGDKGAVKFTGNVTLSGNSVKTISGNTVTISDGKVVTVQGPAPANVFTNNPNYTGFGGNGSTSGTFAGQGATTQPLSAAPGH